MPKQTKESWDIKIKALDSRERPRTGHSKKGW